MPKFEVHIPAANPGGFNMTLKVSADNWMAALKAGMQKLGEQGASAQNVMVDVQDDNSVHVTDATSGRVFRIKELSEEEAAAAQPKRPSGVQPLPKELQQTVTDTSKPKQPITTKLPPPAGMKTEIIPASENPVAHLINQQPTSPAPAPAKRPDLDVTLPVNAGPAPAPIKRSPTRSGKSSPRMEVGDVEELEHPVKPVIGSIGRPKSTAAAQAATKATVEDMLSDVFLRVNELTTTTSIDKAMEFVLDLAMEKVPCEAGSVLRADAASGDLTFICARGPKANEVMSAKIIIPAGSGIAGYAAFEGVSLALSDVEKDPRFYAAVGQKVDYTTKSILCAPMMTHGRSFGCMQLLNRKGGPQFLEHEVGVLAYLSHQAALFLNRQF